MMLTAAGTVGDRVDGLGLGADDYLPKPFDFTELVARVRDAEEHGLGLAIVEAITNAHHAALTAQARRAGGLDIEITFPNPEHPTDF